ncbi:MAG: tRNA threonylcarbamoyladenosine biosynthesis protein TsaE [Urechidicola sp.]|jgi:tRNA threonylcarbamoyladenosine biosynthesis protein TsaE
MKLNYSLDELPEIASKIIQNATYKTILFNGKMGAGKTTLIKEIVKQLGVKDVANSPTFSLVNEYVSENNETIYHFDFYRIENDDEAYDIGIEDYFDSNAWCFIEWGEKVENLLPLEIVTITITVNDNEKRTIQLTADE